MIKMQIVRELYTHGGKLAIVVRIGRKRRFRPEKSTQKQGGYSPDPEKNRGWYALPQGGNTTWQILLRPQRPNRAA